MGTIVKGEAGASDIACFTRPFTAFGPKEGIREWQLRQMGDFLSLTELAASVHLSPYLPQEQRVRGFQDPGVQVIFFHSTT